MPCLHIRLVKDEEWVMMRYADSQERGRNVHVKAFDVGRLKLAIIHLMTYE